MISKSANVLWRYLKNKSGTVFFEACVEWMHIVWRCRQLFFSGRFTVRSAVAQLDH